MFSLKNGAIASTAMEQNPKPKVPNGSSDAPPNIGDIPSASNGSVENQALGPLNPQNGGSAQTSTGNNKTEVEESNIIVDDPFDNARRRILFNAINQLQVGGSQEKLDIPQASQFPSSNQGNALLTLSLAHSGGRAVCWKVIFVEKLDRHSVSC
jgi:hypothetical protein